MPVLSLCSAICAAGTTARYLYRRGGGFCTRWYVESVFVFGVQIGISDKLAKDYVKVYCPKCNDIYDTDRSKVDGAYFGRTFPHFLLICRPDLLPRTTVSVADSKYAMF